MLLPTMEARVKMTSATLVLKSQNMSNKGWHELKKTHARCCNWYVSPLTEMDIWKTTFILAGYLRVGLDIRAR